MCYSVFECIIFCCFPWDFHRKTNHFSTLKQWTTLTKKDKDPLACVFVGIRSTTFCFRYSSSVICSWGAAEEKIERDSNLNNMNAVNLLRDLLYSGGS